MTANGPMTHTDIVVFVWNSHVRSDRNALQQARDELDQRQEQTAHRRANAEELRMPTQARHLLSSFSSQMSLTPTSRWMLHPLKHGRSVWNTHVVSYYPPNSMKTLKILRSWIKAITTEVCSIDAAQTLALIFITLFGL